MTGMVKVASERVFYGSKGALSVACAQEVKLAAADLCESSKKSGASLREGYASNVQGSHRMGPADYSHPSEHGGSSEVRKMRVLMCPFARRPVSGTLQQLCLPVDCRIRRPIIQPTILAPHPDLPSFIPASLCTMSVTVTLGGGYLTLNG